jgi:SAM-dependent methyltransferase
LAIWVGRREGLKGRQWWVFELLRDQAEQDPNGFHRFLWSHHLAYAETYEATSRFGADNLHPSRRLLLHDLAAHAERNGVVLSADIRSVFDVGCSLGYLLRHLETAVCPGAPILEGNDLDAHAIRDGSAFLSRAGSRIRLHVADVSELPRVFAGRTFDLVICAGVLMYLQEADALVAVRNILQHTGRVAVFAGLAHPSRDNVELEGAATRERDSTFIHNLDRLVAGAGGRVVYRRWEGARMVEGNSIYFVFAEPTVS